jgi:hypothetical protein
MASKYVVPYLGAAILVALFPVLAEAGNGNQGHGSKPGPTTTTSKSTSEMSSTVIDQGGFPNAEAVDGSGRPCTAYFNGPELKFAVFDGAAWQIQSLGRQGGDSGATAVSLAVDAQGHPGIVYYVPTELAVRVNRIGFATYDGATWSFKTIDTNGFSPSIAYSPTSGWVVAYVKFDAYGKLLNLAENSGAGWNISTVDPSARSAGTSGGIRGPAVAVDGFGNVGISYGFDIPNIIKAVRYAYRSNGSWTIRTVLSTDLASVTSLAFDANSKPYIGFWAAVSRSLNLFQFNGTGWALSTLPWNGTGTAGQISLALDGSGAVYLTAYDSGSADLLMFSGSAGNFSSRMLASSGTVGQSNSLRPNRATGQKYVTFSDQTIHVLKFIAMY